MMKPICVPCQRFFQMQRSGFYFLEGMPDGREIPPGTSAREQWRPYKLWSGDVWACEGCGATIISGTGQNPISEHYMAEFHDKVTKLAVEQRPLAAFPGELPYQVNDC